MTAVLTVTPKQIESLAYDAALDWQDAGRIGRNPSEITRKVRGDVEILELQVGGVVYEARVPRKDGAA